MSKVHCSIAREGDTLEGGQKWMFRDLGSLNGSMVNGVRVKEVSLHKDDVISLGMCNGLKIGDRFSERHVHLTHDVVYRFSLSGAIGK